MTEHLFNPDRYTRKKPPNTGEVPPHRQSRSGPSQSSFGKEPPTMTWSDTDPFGLPIRGEFMVCWTARDVEHRVRCVHC